MATLNHLSNELLIQIFSYLNLKERTKLELVCSRWKNLFNSFQYDGNLYLTLNSSKEEDIRLKCDQKCHQIDERHIVEVCSENQMLSAIKKTSKVKVIYLNINKAVNTVNLLKAIGDVCKNIEHFEITIIGGGLSVDDASIISVYFAAKLSHLIINGAIIREFRNYRDNYRVDKPCLMNLFTKSENLEVFEMNGNYSIGDALKYLPSYVNHLTVNNQSSYANTLEFMQNSEMRVDIISLNLSIVYDYHILAISVKLTNLTKLTLKYVNANISPLKNLNKLEILKLCLFECRENSIDSLKEMIGSLKMLKSLTLKQCGVDDSFFVHLVTSCLQVEELNIFNFQPVTLITDQALELIEGLERLTTLQLPATNVTDSGIARLLDKRTKLVKLNFRHCKLVTKLSIDKLNEKAGENLKNDYYLRSSITDYESQLMVNCHVYLGDIHKSDHNLFTFLL